MQSITLTENQSVSVVAQPIDAQGNPGLLDVGAGLTPPASSNTSVATITADPANPLNLTVKAVAPGTATMTVTGTAPSGATFSTPFSCTVTGGPAVGFSFTFGTPS